MENQGNVKQPALWLCLSIVLFLIISFLLQLLIKGEPDVHMTLFFASVFASAMLIIFNKTKFDLIEEGIIHGCKIATISMMILMFIGVMIPAWIAAGTIPTLIYYGLKLISPSIFLVTAALTCAIATLCTGTSWGTAATFGVALMGIGGGLGISPGMTAAAVICGAIFGDKMSPLSDTTGIAASIVGVDLFDHIKNMMYTTIPAFIISSIAFGLLSPWNKVGDISSVEQFREDILSTGLVNNLSLICFVTLIILSIFKIPAILSIIYTSIVGLIISIINNHYTLQEISGFLFGGFSKADLSQNIASLLNRGGISSMFFTLTIVILALSLGGLLFGLGIIPTLLDSMAHLLINPSRATICVVLTALGVNYIVGEQYLSILLAGKTFKPIYDKLGLHSKNLSRTLEDAGTVINPLVPWGVCGVFVTSVLGVPTLTYLPFSFFCYLCIILTVISGFTGISITKNGDPDVA